MNDLYRFFSEADVDGVLILLNTNHVAAGSLVFFWVSMLYICYILIQHLWLLKSAVSYRLQKRIGGHVFLLCIFMVTNIMFSVVITHDMTMLEFLEEIWIDLHLFIPMYVASLSYLIITRHLIDGINDQITYTNVVAELYVENNTLREDLNGVITELSKAEESIMNTPKCESNMDVVKRWLK